VWPLLTGERAHYELAAGKDIGALIETYEKFATCGQLLPEQVWDEADLPERSLCLGKPAGSAVPLVWAHAEYLKLMRSAVDGKVFDRIDPVYARYCDPEGRKGRREGLEIFSFQRPIQRIGAGRTLRIMDDGRFEVTWTGDGWQTVNKRRAAAWEARGLARTLPRQRLRGTGMDAALDRIGNRTGGLAWIQCKGQGGCGLAACRRSEGPGRTIPQRLKPLDT